MNTYSLGPNRSITTPQEPIPVKDWLSEGRRRFGSDVRQWRFVCPMCGKEYSVQDFIDAGGKNGANGAFQECIGRYLGAGSPGNPDGNPNGCNWAAYGFFGCAGKGRLVLAEDGTVVEAFHYAGEEAKPDGI